MDFLKEEAMIGVYFSLVLCSITHHGVQLVLEISLVGKTHLLWLRQGYVTSIVVLGWIIPLCVGLGIEPATFRFQSKALITPLPSLRSSSTFLLSLSSLSLFHSLCASSFVSLPPASASRREKKDAEKKNESAFIYATLPIIHFLSL